ncbi:retrovirus-related Pol polyprotein from transposon opus [Trichonephila clavipes]|nr:retrovirus-related Pol polyprotein from transposon opus [Trichonephila clavipes]
MSTDDNKWRNWRNWEVLHRPSNNRNSFRDNYETGHQRNQWFESRNELNRDDRRFDRGYQSGNRVQRENFSREDRIERGSSINFNRDLDYTCILGVDFISGSKFVLDFDRKASAIPDSQMEKVVTTIAEGNEEIYHTKTRVVISKDGITTIVTKIRAVEQMMPPKNSKEASKFLGISQWYSKFIKSYVDVCEPLYNLKKNVKKFFWSVEAHKAFNAVKSAITEAPVSKLSYFKKPFELFTDVSSMGKGVVLNQKQRSVMYAFRTLSRAERNYTVRKDSV